MTTTSLADIQRNLNRAIEKERQSEWNDAFKLYVQCAQQANHISGSLSSESNKAIAKQIAEKALERAQKVKANKSEVKPLTTDEFADYNQQLVIDASSFINGVQYREWSKGLGIDQISRQQPRLSPLQQTRGVAYARLSRPCYLSLEAAPQHLSQNSIDDCSLVAALATCLNHRQKWQGLRLLEDTITGYPNIASTGLYGVRLIVNGVARQIVVDDELPLDPNGNPISARFNESSPDDDFNIFPCLIEKAYMQLHGSYDFPGSNSGTDLHALIGWIPETIFISGGDFVREATWESLFKEFNNGNILVTLGTGKNVQGRLTCKGLNLLPAHCYAVLDIQEEDENRTVTILDPWNVPSLQDQRSYRRSWEDVCNVFDTLYISWNPGMWRYSISIHRTWKSRPSTNGSSKVFNHHIPFMLDSPDIGDSHVWVLLTRHIGKQYPAKTSKFIALHSVEYSNPVIAGVSPDLIGGKGLYVDGYHCLLKLAPLSQAFTIITSLEDESGEGSNYTLTVYSNVPFTLDRRKETYLYAKQESYTFSSVYPGCNFSSPYFMNNPQWRVDIPPTASGGKVSMRLTINGEKTEAYNASLVWSNQGGRISEVAKGDIIASTGSYSYGLASCAFDVKPGTYTLVCSTFNLKRSGALNLGLDCTHAFDIKATPQEGSDMLKRTIKGRWVANQSAGGNIKFGQYGCNPQVNVHAVTPTSLFARLRSTMRTPKNLTIFHSTEPKVLGKEVATSGAYDDSIAGVVSKKALLPPGNYIIVPSTHLPETEGDWEVTVFYDKRDTQIF